LRVDQTNDDAEGNSDAAARAEDNSAAAIAEENTDAAKAEYLEAAAASAAKAE